MIHGPTADNAFSDETYFLDILTIISQESHETFSDESLGGGDCEQLWVLHTRNATDWY